MKTRFEVGQRVRVAPAAQTTQAQKGVIYVVDQIEFYTPRGLRGDYVLYHLVSEDALRLGDAAPRHIVANGHLLLEEVVS